MADRAEANDERFIGNGHRRGTAERDERNIDRRANRRAFPTLDMNGAGHAPNGDPGIRLRKRRRLPGPFTALPTLRRERR